MHEVKKHRRRTERRKRHRENKTTPQKRASVDPDFCTAESETETATVSTDREEQLLEDKMRVQNENTELETSWQKMSSSSNRSLSRTRPFLSKFLIEQLRRLQMEFWEENNAVIADVSHSIEKDLREFGIYPCLPNGPGDLILQADVNRFLQHTLLQPRGNRIDFSRTCSEPNLKLSSQRSDNQHMSSSVRLRPQQCTNDPNIAAFYSVSPDDFLLCALYESLVHVAATRNERVAYVTDCDRGIPELVISDLGKLLAARFSAARAQLLLERICIFRERAVPKSYTVFFAIAIVDVCKFELVKDILQKRFGNCQKIIVIVPHLLPAALVGRPGFESAMYFTSYRFCTRYLTVQTVAQHLKRFHLSVVGSNPDMVPCRFSCYLSSRQDVPCQAFVSLRVFHCSPCVLEFEDDSKNSCECLVDSLLEFGNQIGAHFELVGRSNRGFMREAANLQIAPADFFDAMQEIGDCA